jgi:hypothetical protein
VCRYLHGRESVVGWADASSTGTKPVWLPADVVSRGAQRRKLPSHVLQDLRADRYPETTPRRSKGRSTARAWRGETRASMEQALLTLHQAHLQWSHNTGAAGGRCRSG